MDVFTNHKSLRYVFTQKELNLLQRRWIEFLKDYNINVLYHPGTANPGTANVIENALNILPIGSVAHVEDDKKKLSKEVHRLTLLEVFLINISNDGLIVQKGSKCLLVTEVNKK